MCKISVLSIKDWWPWAEFLTWQPPDWLLCYLINVKRWPRPNWNCIVNMHYIKSVTGSLQIQNQTRINSRQGTVISHRCITERYGRLIDGEDLFSELFPVWPAKWQLCLEVLPEPRGQDEVIKVHTFTVAQCPCGCSLSYCSLAVTDTDPKYITCR